MTNKVSISCDQNVKNYIDYIDVNYTQTIDEYNVIVNNIDELNDEELCSHYGIDYDHVNCIKLI